MTPDKYQAAIAAARAYRKLNRIELGGRNTIPFVSVAERMRLEIIGRAQSILRLEIEQTGADFDDVYLEAIHADKNEDIP